MTKSEDLKLFGTIVTLMVIWPISAKVEQCGSILRGEGVLQSHNFPNRYPNNYDCDWSFEAGPDDEVQLEFTHFDVEESRGCRYDYLQVFAMGQDPKYCGKGVHKVAPGGIINAKGPVKLVFKSDNSDNMQGFRLKYKISQPEPEEEGIVSCDDDPCKNGADCIDVDHGEVACFCLDGFEGDFCEINIDECGSNPCQNGGTCVDEVDGFTCDCPEGFLGATCGVDVDDCVADPCRNGGTCIDGPNSFECQCVAGYTGWNCGQEIDECVSGPCLNMGVCEDRIGFYECVCFPGYTGVNCEIPPPTTAAPETAPQTTTSAPEPPPPIPEPPPPVPDDPAADEVPSSSGPVEPQPRSGEPDTTNPEESDAKSPPETPPQTDADPRPSPDDHQSPPPDNQRHPEPNNENENDNPAAEGTPESTGAAPTTELPNLPSTKYPNSTVPNNIHEPSEDPEQQHGDKEDSTSDTGLIIGVVAALLGIAALASLAVRYWMTKQNTKVEPVVEAPEPTDPKTQDSENTVEQKEPEQKEPEQKVESQQKEPEQKEPEQNSNIFDLFEEDFSGT